ncbi:MAG TPA: ABC transporter permease [Flavobacteriales bacterium]|nr:ABC transporter permease [Flavobacteriales bacterium]|tara:strand:+ start:14801 stop:15580 length:780 start_codon:yes stop_codon:yes gene_type:complete
MNHTTIDISYLNLALGYLLLIIPFFLLHYYKTGLLKDALIANLRMTVQLLLIGVYLEFLFKLDNFLLNIAWVIIMIVISAFTIGKRSELPVKKFFLPIFISSIFTLSGILFYFLYIVLEMENILTAAYFIPISGMLLGNTIKTVILALNDYYQNLKNNQTQYRWYLANGATIKEALLPFKAGAMKKAFNPVIATTAIVGLISIPGMMTGQILGGNSPTVAVKYQIMLMITIFSVSIISVALTIYFSDKQNIDKAGNFKF